IFRCFALMHDAVHGSLTKNEFVNDFIGIIAGSFCFLPFLPRRKIHLKHHFWAGNIEKDPTMKIVKDFSRRPDQKRYLLDFAWRSWLPILALMQHLVFWISALGQWKDVRNYREAGYMFLSYAVPAILYYTLAEYFVEIWPGLILYLILVE